MPNTSRAIDALPAPDYDEIRAAHAAGVSVVRYRAMQKQEPAQRGRISEISKSQNLKHRAECLEQSTTSARDIAILLPWSCLHSLNGTWTIRTKEYQGAKRRAVQKIADVLYKSEPQGAGAGAKAEGGRGGQGKDDDNVIDADFEVKS